MYDVVISLLVYNQLEVTRECIESLFKTSKSNFLVVISDNNSRQETADYLRGLVSKHSNVVYVRNDKNLGFITAHNNIYAQYSVMSDYFCVLNNDLIFHTEGWDSKFITELEVDKKLAQVGPMQVHGYINAKGVGIPRPNKRLPPEYIEGSCFIAKVSAIGEKLFEAKYMNFAFCEDADLSFRLRNAGYTIKEVQGVTIQHKHHVSFKNEKLDFDFKEQERANQRFLVDRWQKYMRVRSFTPLQILVIRSGALGDSFMVEPIARELLNKYPGSHIYIQTKCPDWFNGSDYIKGFGINLRQQRKYDIVINLDMAYEENAKKHIVDAYAQRAMLILDKDKRTPLYLGIEKKQKRVKTAVINAEGSWQSRQWPIDRIRAFAEHLQRKGYKVFEVGRTQELYTGAGENLIGKLGFKEVVQLISESSFYFGMDGGLAHFAQSVGTDCFLIFGCTNPAYRVHNNSNVKSLWLNDLPCAGCHHEAAVRTFTQCKTGKYECLNGITTEYAINEFEVWDNERNSQA